jgi:tRNA threonylcarbamoyladenosine biosynthesis protein TsaE
MSFVRELPLADLTETEALARRLAIMARPGDIFALQGPLGVGKSALARAFIRALTSDIEDVPSPTFTLVQSYDSAKGALYHFDLYRLEAAEQAEELGIDDAFADGISLVEWPEMLGGLLPRRRLWIGLVAGPQPDSRIARLNGVDLWQERWV